VQQLLTSCDVVAVGIACTWHQGIPTGDKVRVAFDKIISDWERTGAG
jgi:hypothetical protein